MMFCPFVKATTFNIFMINIKHKYFSIFESSVSFSLSNSWLASAIDHELFSRKASKFQITPLGVSVV